MALSAEVAATRLVGNSLNNVPLPFAAHRLEGPLVIGKAKTDPTTMISGTDVVTGKCKVLGVEIKHMEGDLTAFARALAVGVELQLK